MKIAYIMAICIIALSSAAMAAPFSGVTTIDCTKCTAEADDIDPGEQISLDGTIPAANLPTILGVTVTPDYAWAFYKVPDTSGAINCPITSWTTISVVGLTSPSDVPAIQFNAPALEGCYMAVLTVQYRITVAGMTLATPCVNWACYTFCVDVDCATCNDIFCEEDCGAFPTSTATNYCVDATGTGSTGALCYPGDQNTTTVQVKWFVLTGQQAAVTQAQMEAGVLANTDFCFRNAFWCDQDAVAGTTDPVLPGAYTVVMGVYAKDSTDAWVFSDLCIVGTVAVVDTPEPTIS